MKVAIIGGGAGGFFSAIAVKNNYPNAQVIIFEKSSKTLAKVKISGGGRCNVTNGETSIKELTKAYPRGGKFLKKALTIFNTKDTREWFESRGVSLILQEDNCVFPKAQNSQAIIDCFYREAQSMNIEIITSKGVQSISTVETGILLSFVKNEFADETFDKVIVATGGSPRRQGLYWLEDVGHKIEDPVPSLFTFNMPSEKVIKLMGIVVEKTIVSIQGTKLKASGPLLITHWGMSGPAILKLSAFGARILSQKEYRFVVQVNWVNEVNNDLVQQTLQEISIQHGNKLLQNHRAYKLSERLWLFLLEKCELSPRKKWSELGKKGINKLVNILTNDTYTVSGKTTFKEEFVTCGGVSLRDIKPTMESKIVDNLYFCGEVLDIDGITGGYNFQAAWTTGFIAGRLY